MRFIKTFWALDASLAYSRHYPSINWMNSYSGYTDDISTWWHKNIDQKWKDKRQEMHNILQKEDTLKEIVKLLGPESLPDEEKLVLEVARMIKIGFLQQNSFDDIDTYCSPQKQFKIMDLLLSFYHKGQDALKNGAELQDIRELDVVSAMIKARMIVHDDSLDELDKISNDMDKQFSGLKIHA